MKKRSFFNFSFLLYFTVIAIFTICFSNFINAQVKTLAEISLSDDEKVVNVYADSLQKTYAVVIKKTVEGMVSSVTEYYIVTPKDRIGPFEKVIDVCFFDNSNQMLISIKIDGLFYVIKNNEKTGPFENISRFSAIYSKNNFAYWIKENGKLYIVTQDKKYGPYGEVSSFVTDQKSQKIVWVAKSDKAEIFVNGVSLNKADKIVIFGFYTEKSLLCYVVGTSGTYSLVVGNKKYGPYDNIGLDLAVKDENLAVFFAKISGSWYLIAGKEKAGPFDSTGFVAISPDGKKIAYAGYKESSGWSIYLGAKLIKNISQPYFAFLDFVKIDDNNYDIIYLVGEYKYDGYYWQVFVGENEESTIDYIFDSDSPYVGSLNIPYYGVDFIFDNNGIISFLSFNNGEYAIKVYSMSNDLYGIYGPGESYDTTFILDIAYDIVFFVLNGEFFVGSYSYLSTEGYSDEKLTGRIIYGNDGIKIGVLYFDPESNTLCYVDIKNARDAILSNFNQ